jgi:hypothetical protein
MEEMFQLKHYGKFSLLEMNLLTAEDRKWWMERLKKQQEAEEHQMKGGPSPQMPGLPR